MHALLTLISLTVVSGVAIVPVQAEEVCKVTDPTGTPLNVRSSPNGEIVNALRNGREVYIHEVARDSQGRAWVKIGGYYDSRYRTWGWVIREFLSCYSR
ncbi:MAG: SH3 domain-containing protein [Aphanocapsa sp. GSE-SYN-MK-11-07L]|nr:SH3 domain-containing protein [Aphanocapsa sp. GSE-SYN-MK-11-07L]